jgi:glycosyltransferase involved in cell wall biosynthesis
MKPPYFSIIIATHERPRLLARAMQSVCANTFTDHEMIVISDTVDEQTMHVVSQNLRPQDTFSKRIGKHGPALSRNMGLSLARGKYIIFLDDDDAFSIDYLERAFLTTLDNPGCVIYTDYCVIQEDRERPDIPPLPGQAFSVANADFNALYVKNFILNHSVIFPHEAVHGRFQDPHLSSLDDWDFLLNVASDTPFVHASITGAMVYKDYVNQEQRRGHTTTANGMSTVTDYLSIYKKWPAPSLDLRVKRQQLLASAGQHVPIDWV